MPANRLPPSIDEPGIIVGYSLEDHHKKIPYGFSFGTDDYTPQDGYLDPYLFHGEGHLLTIAPTGAGKGVSSLIPAALRHQGDLVVIDPKGENFAITAKRRSEIGQDICLIDPFGVTKSVDFGEITAGGINVFELLPYLAECDAAADRALAGMLLQNNHGSGSDPFWGMSATSILAGLIDFYAHDPDGGTVCDLLDDLFRFPHERNRIVSKETPLERQVDKDTRLQQILKRFSLHVWQIEEAYREHRDLRNGKLTTRRTVSVEQQILMSNNDIDDLFPYADKEVEVSNRDFGVAICEFSGSEPDKRILDILFAAARATFSESDAQTSRQERVKRFLSAGDSYEISYPIAILRMMSSQRELPEQVSAMIASTPDRTWGSMLTTLHNGLSYLNSVGIRHAISQTTLDLTKFREGTGTSIYLVFPPHRLVTHAQLLSTLFKGLINILVTRTRRPEKSTLFLMDEVAQLGHVDEFVAAQTLLRGYGVQIWSFWQDLSQLQAVYPNIWPTIINNCKVFQAFGCATPMMARAMEDIFMVPAATILDLEKDELILSIYGDEPVIARKPQYYSDPVFRGQFSSNPLFGDLPNSTDGKDAVENFIEMPSKIVRKFEFKVKKRKRFISN